MDTPVVPFLRMFFKHDVCGLTPEIIEKFIERVFEVARTVKELDAIGTHQLEQYFDPMKDIEARCLAGSLRRRIDTLLSPDDNNATVIFKAYDELGNPVEPELWVYGNKTTTTLRELKPQIPLLRRPILKADKQVAWITLPAKYATGTIDYDGEHVDETRSLSSYPRDLGGRYRFNIVA